MKKIILSAAAVLIFGFANAQEAPKKVKASTSVEGGLKAGLNMASVTNSDGGKAIANFHAGAFATIWISDKFSIQPEAMYSGQGVKGDGLTFHLNYINIPVMAQYHINREFAVEAGPQIGFLIKAEITDGDNSADVKDAFNTTDFGFNFGASYAVSDEVTIGIRYNAGISDLIKEVDPGVQNSQNSVFQIGVAFKL